MADRQLAHGELEERSNYLERDSEAHRKLRRQVFDPSFLRKLPYYTKCRASAPIESFQHLRISYAAKRQSYGYDAYFARNKMAAIDHMLHNDRGFRCRKIDDTIMETVRYSKAAKHLVKVEVKFPKHYNYFPELNVAFLRKRCELPPKSERPSHVYPEGHPIHIQRTIAPSPKPPTDEIRRKPRSKKLIEF